MDYLSNYSFDSEISIVFQEKILPLIEGRKVLDLGCGKGSYMPYFGEGSLGLDVSPAHIKEVCTKCHRAKTMDLNAPEDLKEKFDVVFMSHVLEHVDSPINLLRYANSSLAKDGMLIVSVPNETSLINLIYPYYSHDGNHLYGFTTNNIKELVTQTGFSISSVYYDYYTVLTQKLKLNTPLHLMNIFPNIIKGPFSWAFWFVCRKGNDV